MKLLDRNDGLNNFDARQRKAPAFGGGFDCQSCNSATSACCRRRLIDRPYSTYLERHADLALEIPLDRGTRETCSTLAYDLAERQRHSGGRGADGEIRSVGLRMIQDVRGIDPERYLFALRETERFLDVPIQKEYAEGVQCTAAERSNFPRLGIHQYIDHGCSVRQHNGAGRVGGDFHGERVERTEREKRRGDQRRVGTLRVFLGYVRVSEKRATVSSRPVPFDVAFRDFPQRTRHGVTGVAVSRRFGAADAGGLTGAQVENETRLPSFDEPRDPTVRAGE